MIRIFSGKWRGLGENQDGLGMLLDFRFREVLHQFKGARLHVFIDIALHSDENGFSFPGYQCISKETGLSTSTIAQALEDLCSLEINGHRVLLRYRERDEKGLFTGSNRYLIFPTKEEIQKYESTDPDFDFPDVDLSRCGKIEVKHKPLINLNHSLSNTGANAPSAPEEEKSPIVKNEGAFRALQVFENKKGEVDYSPFPEEVRETIREFCRLWRMHPPARSPRGGGPFALWITDARDLEDACGEFGFKALQRAYDDWSQTPFDRRFTVARPGSVVNYARAKAAEMRQAQEAAAPAMSKTEFEEAYRYLYGEVQ